MKEIGFQEFQELNKNFEYHITFKGTVLSNQQKLVDAAGRVEKFKAKYNMAK
jgi:ribosomal protein L31